MPELENDLFIDENESIASSDQASPGSDDEQYQAETRADNIYRVRKILAERQIEDANGDPLTQYLVYWAGWPELDSTWEPRENFQEESPLEEWRLTKQLEAEGKRKPYDVENFNARVAAAHEKAIRKANKRNQLRRDSDESAATDQNSSPLRQTNRNRARQLKRRRVATDSDESSASSSDLSLKNVKRHRVSKPIKKGTAFKKGSNTSTRQSPDAFIEDVTISASQASLFNSSPHKPTHPPTKNTIEKPMASKSSTLTAATRTAPKPVPKPISRFANTPVAPKSLTSLAKAKTANSTDNSKNVFFRNLSMQNRANRAGRVREAPPDPACLTFITPATGQIAASTAPAVSKTTVQPSIVPNPEPAGLPPKTRLTALEQSISQALPTSHSRPQSQTQTASRLAPLPPIPDSAFERSRKQMPSLPPKPPPKPLPPSSSAETVPLYHVYPKSMRKSNVTCRAWRWDRCRFGNACNYAHKLCDITNEKIPETCEHWKKGYCQFKDLACNRWHRWINHDSMTFVDSYQATQPGSVRPVSVQNGHITHSNTAKSKIETIETLIEIANPATSETVLRIPSISLQVLNGYDVISKSDTIKSRIFRLTHICSMFEVDRLIEDATPIATGRFFCNEKEASKCLALSEYLRAARAQLRDGDYCMFILSAKEASALHSSDAPFPHGVQPADLCFEVYRLSARIRSESDDLLAPPLVIDSAPPLAIACKQPFREVDHLHIFGNRNEKRLTFLMFPTHLSTEIEVITAHLSSLHGATVYHAGIAGAWNAFYDDFVSSRAQNSVVLYHPSMHDYSDMADLRKYLVSGGFRHYELIVDEETHVYRLVRLFPTGEALLVTDHVLKYFPQKALAVIDCFEREYSLKDPIVRRDQLVFRPDILPFLNGLLEHADSTGDMALAELYAQIGIKVRRMLGTSRLELQTTSSSQCSSVTSQSTAKAPEYASLWASDEDKATAWLVEWFAGWACQQREKIRRFVAIHQSAPHPSTDDVAPGSGAGSPTTTEVMTPNSSVPDPEEARRSWNLRFGHMTVIDPARYLKGKERKK